MKYRSKFIVLFLLIVVPFSEGVAWELPENAIARIGKGEINDIAYSPDGKLLAVGSEIGTWLSDAHTGEELALLTGHTDEDFEDFSGNTPHDPTVSFSPDGKMLAAVCWDGKVRVWDVQTRKHITTLMGFWRSALFSPDGKLLATSDTLWDTRTFERKNFFKERPTGARAYTFSPDSTTLVTELPSQTLALTLWNIETEQRKIISIRQEGNLNSVAYSPDGTTLAFGGMWNRTVQVWDMKTGLLKAVLTGHTKSVHSVVYSPDGTTLATACWDMIRLWDAKTGQHKLTITKPSTFIEIEYTPDGKTLTSVSTDGKIQLWDAKTGQDKGILTHIQKISSMLPSPDGKKIVTGVHGDLLLWDISTGHPKPIFTVHPEYIEPLLFSPDGTTVTCVKSSMENFALLLCNIHTEKREIAFTHPVEGFYSRVLSPDGKTLALRTGSNNIQLWNTSTSKRKATLTKPEEIFTAMVFSPDSSLLVTGDSTGAIEVWDTATGQHKSVLTNQEGGDLLVFSPDGEVLASSRWREVRLWNIETGTQISPTLRTFESKHAFHSLAFSPDGTVLASGGYDAKIRLWNVQTGDLKETLIGHTGPIESLVFLSPEQPSGSEQAENEVFSRPKTTLASRSRDGTVLLWNIKHFVGTKAAVNITPPSVESPEIGEQLTLNVDIAGGENVRVYDLTLEFDAATLRYVSSGNGGYLPRSATFDASLGPQWMRAPNRVNLVGTCPPSESKSGDGTLASVTFEVIKAEASTVHLPKVQIEKSDGSFARPNATHAAVLNPFHTQNLPTDYTQFALPEGAKARLGKGTIYDIKFSPDNTQFAVATSIGIWMYDADTGAELALITEHTKPVSAIAFSAKGELLASSGYDGTIRLWDSRNYQHLKTFKAGSATLAFSPGGTTLFNGRQLWNVHTGQLFATIKPGNSETVTDAAFSPDGTILATITRKNKIELWDANSGQRKTLLHEEEFADSFQHKVVFSLDGTQLAAIGSQRNLPNNSILLWDIRTGELLKTFSEKDNSFIFSSIDFSAQGELITVSKKWHRTLHLQNFRTNEKLAVLDGHTERVQFTVLSPDKRTLVSAEREGIIRLWDIERTKVRTTVTGYGHPVNPIVVSDEGKTLVLGNHDEHRHLWHLISPQFSDIIRDMNGGFVARAIAFSPNSATLVGKSSEHVYLWDTNTYKQKFIFKEDPHQAVAAAFSPDGRTFAVATRSSNLIHLWNMDTGQRKLTLKGHAESIDAITFSPDGTTIATAEILSEGEKAIRLWDAKTGNHHTTFANLINPEEKRRLPILSVAFSPDGKTLASTDGSRDIQLWDIDTGKHKTTLHSVEDRGYYAEDSAALTFSPDGTTLSSSVNDFIIHVWDVGAGKHQGALKGHTGAVVTLTYSADGTTLISRSKDGTALLWQMKPAPIPRLNITPLSVEAPPTGKQLTFSVNMADGQNVTGYKFRVLYNAEALRYIPDVEDNIEIADVKIIPPVVAENAVTLAGSAAPDAIINDGTIATATFEIIKRADVILTLTDAALTDNTGADSRPLVGHAWIVEPPRIPEDANRDWQVDAADLEFVASQLGQTGKENSADINGDGIVDLADLVLVTNALYGPAPELDVD